MTWNFKNDFEFWKKTPKICWVDCIVFAGVLDDSNLITQIGENINKNKS
jgi:hypothetical protein